MVAGILPAVEGGTLPPGPRLDFPPPPIFDALSAGLEARLYGRQDARRHERGTFSSAKVLCSGHWLKSAVPNWSRRKQKAA